MPTDGTGYYRFDTRSLADRERELMKVRRTERRRQRRANRRELLTREQVEALPEGTRVVITWSGGNGPHEYVIARDTYGTYAALNDDPDDPMRWYNPITFVGSERFHTHVGLVEGTRGDEQ